MNLRDKIAAGRVATSDGPRNQYDPIPCGCGARFAEWRDVTEDGARREYLCDECFRVTKRFFRDRYK